MEDINSHISPSLEELTILAEKIAFEENFGEYGKGDFESIDWTFETFSSNPDINRHRLKEYILRALLSVKNSAVEDTKRICY
jgi:hypothetical protein